MGAPGRLTAKNGGFRAGQCRERVRPGCAVREEPSWNNFSPWGRGSSSLSPARLHSDFDRRAVTRWGLSPTARGRATYGRQGVEGQRRRRGARARAGGESRWRDIEGVGERRMAGLLTQGVLTFSDTMQPPYNHHITITQSTKDGPPSSSTGLIAQGAPAGPTGPPCAPFWTPGRPLWAH
jgi:hypothetical protein